MDSLLVWFNQTKEKVYFLSTQVLLDYEQLNIFLQVSTSWQDGDIQEKLGFLSTWSSFFSQVRWQRWEGLERLVCEFLPLECGQPERKSEREIWIKIYADGDKKHFLDILDVGMELKEGPYQFRELPVRAFFYPTLVPLSDRPSVNIRPTKLLGSTKKVFRKKMLHSREMRHRLFSQLCTVGLPFGLPISAH